MIKLIKITGDNWEECINLKLNKEEEKFIFPNVYSIAQAQFYPKANSEAIFFNGKIVGYIMYGEDEDDNSVYYIDRLMISKDFRHNGIASKTINLIKEKAEIKGYKKIVTSTHQENNAMKSFLVKNEFKTEEELDGDEIIYYFEIK